MTIHRPIAFALLSLSSFLLVSGHAAAHVCVSSQQQLIDALAGADGDVRLRTGYYALTHSGSGVAIPVGIQGTEQYTVSGGWGDNCVSQGSAPSDSSVLDGQGNVGIFEVIFTGMGSFKLSRLHLFDGDNAITPRPDDGCVDVRSVATGAAGSVTVEHVRFESCHGAALALEGEFNGNLVRNNLFLNSDVLGGSALLVQDTGVGTYVYNNTFRGTRGSSVASHVAFNFGGSPMIFSNNLVAETVLPSGATELVGQFVTGRNNRLLSAGGIGGSSPILLHTTTEAPGFAGILNPRLQPESAMRNGGYNNVTLGPGSLDLDMRPRTSEGIVDIGAYEYEPRDLFKSGFE